MYQDPILSYPIAMGVKVLDECVPGWFRESSDPEMKTIDLDKLDIATLHHCILGQLFGHYGKGIARLDINFHDAEQMGFAVPEQVSVTNYGAIYKAYTREWTDVITARRAAGV